MRKTTRLFLIILCLALTGGCIYRASISQGNLIRPDDLEQIEVGMTKTQIRYLLGTPMIDDPFSSNRWDYVYYLNIRRDPATHKRWLTVNFVDEKVSEILKDQELSPDL